MNSVDYGLGALALSMSGVLVVGVTSVARRATLPRRAAARLGAVLAIALAGWLVLTAGLAAAGVLARWDAMPPRVPLLPLTALATMILLSRTRTFTRLVEAVPPAWPIAMQTFRLPVEVAWGALLSLPGTSRGSASSRTSW